MRHLVLPVLIVGLFLSPDVQAQEEVRAILTRAIRARGGSDKELVPRATREKARAVARQDGLTYVTDVTIQYPSQVRLQMNIEVQGAQSSMTAAMEGGKGWVKLDGVMQDLPDESVALLQRALYEGRVCSLRPLLDEEGFKLSPLGESKVQGRAAVGVKVAHKGQKDFNLYFDKETGLLVKTAARIREEGSRREILEENYFSDYRELDPLAAEKQVLQAAQLAADGPALLDFFRTQTLSEADRDKLKGLIRQLGDNSFAVRERASAELVARGAAARPLLRQALKDPELEITRRAEDCLKVINSRTSAATIAAAARFLAVRKPVGAAEVLLAYLPSAPDEEAVREVRLALTDLALRDGKPDPVLVRALEDKDPLRRAAAAAALRRDGKPPQEQLGRKRFFPGLKCAMKTITDRDGKRYMEQELLDIQFFDRVDDQEFARPK